MTSVKPTAEQFAETVAGHQMTVVLDQGLHRHLTFKRPETSNRYFHITTWPGYLTISGDMGCYVFARLPDMFSFFRSDLPGINPDYWGEKLQAVSKSEGYVEFSRERFVSAIVRDFRSYYPPGTTDRMDIWHDMRSDILFSLPETTDSAISAAMRYTDPNGDSPFNDFWDHNLQSETYHYIWCCRAICWAIRQYDAAKGDIEAAA